MRNPFAALKDSVGRTQRLIKAGLAGIRSPGFDGEVHFDPARFVWHDSSVYNGFPLGAIGTGAIRVGTQGGFLNLTINNNWMDPIPKVRGSFMAVSCSDGSRRVTRVLRRGRPAGEEYDNLIPIAHCTFHGRPPCFEQHFSDPALYVEPTVRGFVPLVPHDDVNATTPVAVFRVELRNISERPVEASLLFSWENVLGCGGTGETGVSLYKGKPVKLYGRKHYKEVRGNYQRALEPDVFEDLVGISFETARSTPPGSHQQSTLGRYLLLAEQDRETDVTVAETWDANWGGHRAVSRFAMTGELQSWDSKRAIERPAGAVCSKTHIRPGEMRALYFYLAWWLPNHVTEQRPCLEKPAPDGVDVGHIYASHYPAPEDAIRSVHQNRNSLLTQTRAVHNLLDHSDLPAWLVHALLSSADSAITNTVVPRDGTLYTIEGAGWDWFFGGLTGTADQRLAGHPWMATFLPTLDRRELETFTRLRSDGQIPHGNGNCDLGLGTSHVPYGWPVQLLGALDDAPWPDLTLSVILQYVRAWLCSGGDWIEEVADVLFQLADVMIAEAAQSFGVPEGGSTFDTWSFPGTFIYTASLYLTALDALTRLARHLAPHRVEGLQKARREAAERTEHALWQGFDGYYRACDQRDTIFMGGLAGVWFAEWAGLPWPLQPARVRRHMERQHRLFHAHHRATDRNGAFPVVEMTPSGSPIPHRVLGLEVPGYAWQMVAYHGMVALRCGLVREGLAAIRAPFQRMWHGGWPWSADLYGNAGPNYMSHGVLWSLPNLLAGAAINVPEQRLTLAPVAPERTGWNLNADMQIPVFFPGFWGQVTVDQGGIARRLDVTRSFGEPHTIRSLRVTRGEQPLEIALSEPWELVEGASFAVPAPAGAAP